MYDLTYDPLPIRWVLTRDPLGKRHPKAIFSTDPAQTAEQVVSDFMKRWSLELTFEEGRAHLGIETQRQWSDRATLRSTPLLFGLYSLVKSLPRFARAGKRGIYFIYTESLTSSKKR